MKYFILIVIFIFSGCSFLIDTYEKQTTKQFEYKQPVGNRLCKGQSNIEIFSETPNLSKKFPEWIKNNPNFTEIEYSIIFLLAQMKSSPHIISPTAAFDIIIANKSNYLHFNFSHQSVQAPFPFLMGLKYLLTTFPSRYKLSELARIVDKRVNIKVPISTNFYQFLTTNRDETDSKLKNRFFIRGSEILKLSETIKFKDLEGFIRDVEKLPTDRVFIDVNFFRKKVPISFGPNQNKGYCNIDVNKYEKSIYPTQIKSLSQHFGISIGDFHAHGVINQEPSMKALRDSPFLKSKSPSTSVPLCVYEDGGNKYWFLSSQSRDPAQHLYHLLQYDLGKIKDNNDILALQNFSRHLFLKSPPRLLYEANRGSTKQLNNLLKLDFPIYYRNTLGKITSSISRGSRFNYLLDNRHNMEIFCEDQQ